MKRNIKQDVQLVHIMHEIVLLEVIVTILRLNLSFIWIFLSFFTQKSDKCKQIKFLMEILTTFLGIFPAFVHTKFFMV